MANEAQAKRWNDPRWTAVWPERERLTDAVTPYVVGAARARSGERVVDIGCGGGGLSTALAREVAPDGEVVGLDLSTALVELARQRATDRGVTNVRYVTMDVQTGAEEPGPFDVAVSQFGVMFFDEPTSAFSAIRRRLHPSGRFVFACWQGIEVNRWHIGCGLRGLLPPAPTPPPGKSPVGAFALGDEEYVCEILEAAGFGAVTVVPHAITVRGPASAIVDRSLISMMGVAPEREEEAVELAHAHLQRFAVPDAADQDEYDFPISFYVFAAAAS